MDVPVDDEGAVRLEQLRQLLARYERLPTASDPGSAQRLQDARRALAVYEASVISQARQERPVAF